MNASIESDAAGAAAAVDAAVHAAAAAAETFAASPAGVRAALLRGLAGALEAAREQLVPLADRETHLGPARLNGELDRTAFQLRGFADEVETGAPFAVVDDPAVAGAPPAGRPHLTRVRVPVGVVAMFAASNFPFAFSVLGGDTASALAAGCAIVIKAHPGHPELSRATHALTGPVLAALGLPAGLIGLVDAAGVEAGVQLVRHPRVDAVAFTGSLRGGLALQAECQARPRPIPFYGELGAVNPVVVLPAAAAARGPELAVTLAGSIALGCGQFCTNPGLVIAFDDAASQGFVGALAQALAAQRPHAMLNEPIARGFAAGVARLGAHPRVRTHLKPSTDGTAPTPGLFECDAAAFVADAALHDEVFGPASLVVRVRSVDEAVAVLQAIGGSLTATIWGAEGGGDEVRRLVHAATRIAGRVLFGGVPTGVAVTRAQQHGGPFPASTQPFTTSVGWAAMDRFLRPVALQDAPVWLRAREGVPC